MSESDRDARNWVRALTDERLSLYLIELAGNPGRFTALRGTWLLLEASDRLILRRRDADPLGADLADLTIALRGEDQ